MSVSFKILGNIGIIEFDLPDAKVNLLTSVVMRQLDSLLDEIVSQKPKVDAILLTSGKKDVFIAGADIKEIDGITQSEVGVAKARAGQDVLNKLEDLPYVTIAVIDGVALGGGCELALACRYRVGTFNEKVRIGLPEVNLGILPGFGGTYRLPRLVGLSQALGVILAGKVLGGQEAFKIGLIDRLYPHNGLGGLVAKFVEEVKGSSQRNPKFNKRPKGIPGLVDRYLPSVVFSQAKDNVLRATKGFYPAPAKALEVIRKNYFLPRAAGLHVEAQGFSELVVTDVSKCLVHVFYITEKYKKLSPAECEGMVPVVIRKCAVVGAGIMGGGIAQLLAYNDIIIRLKDINYDAVGKGLQAAHAVFEQAVKKRRLKKAQAQVKMAQISGTTDYSGFQNVDCVIEAVVENLDVKKKVFQDISNAVAPTALLCTNTSALSVTEMAKVVANPQRLVGFHFFNPVHRMPLIEVIKTATTSPQAIATALNLVKRLGKTPVLVKDAPGFLVNRILLGYINEAGWILEEGEDPAVIDKLMTDFGMPMGPLLLSDEVGLDVGIKVLHILEAGLGERFRPAAIFDKVFQKGLLGKKSGKGFYVHNTKQRQVNLVIDTLRPRQKISPAHRQDYLSRMVYVMINEAARCLEDRIVDDPAAVDVGMIMGTGFPPFRGGLLRYADQVGLENVVDALKIMDSKYSSSRFSPCAYLLELAQKGKKFYAPH